MTRGRSVIIASRMGWPLEVGSGAIEVSRHSEIGRGMTPGLSSDNALHLCLLWLEKSDCGEKGNMVMRSNRIQILHLTETAGPGGAEMLMVRLVERLETKYESRIGLIKDGWLATEMRNRGVPVQLYENQGSTPIPLIRQLAGTIRREKIDLIHSHEFLMNTYAAAASILTGVPQLATVHGRNYYGDRARRRAAYRAVSRRACIVAVCGATKEYLIERVGVAPRRIRVVHNGVDVEDARPIDNSKIVGHSSQRGPTICTVGRLSPVKGLSDLLLAVRDLIMTWPTLQLLVVGQGRLEGVLKQQVMDLGLSKNVQFTGHLENLRDVWLRVDVFALPSLSEGLPLSLLEAMAAGIPSVATRVGGVGEVIEDGETGLLVPPGDRQALAEGIMKLLEDRTLARQMGKAAQETVVRCFSLTKMVQAYREIYADLIQSRNGRAQT